MKVLSFDLETENHILNKRLASPFDKRNYIVQIGWSVNGGKPQEKYYTDWHREDVLPEELDSMGKGDVLNGFNIKFDLLWVWKEKRLQDFLKRGGTVYCGQYAEYLLGGMTQDVQMCAMNDIAETYGGGCKIDAVKDMWENGALTSEIPRDLLTAYLIGDDKGIVGDINNTWLIFVGQIARMRAEHPPEFRRMLQFRMDGLLATTEMEYNGMFVDKEIGERLRLQLVEDLEVARETLDSFIPELPPELTFNWGSPQMKSCLIFGGVVQYKKWLAHTDENGNVLYAKKKETWPLFTYNGEQRPVDPTMVKLAGSVYIMEVPEGTEAAFKHKERWYIVQDTYKSGKNAGTGKTKDMSVPDLDKPKGSQQPHYFKFNGYTKPHPSWKGDATDAYDNPLYSTDASVIEKLAERKLPFTDALTSHSKISKDLSSYYWTESKNGTRKGMLTLVNDEGIIHHKLNLTSTVTSRMSSSDPNLQTLPRSDEDSAGVAKSNVKQMFRSRFGSEGRMGEIDYSQLEVVVQGVLSNDKQLCQDLRDRVDFHCKRLAAKLNESYEDVLRKAKKEKLPEYVKGRTNAKIFSFQRAYGAGVDTIVSQTGMSKADVEALIQAELKLYPSVAEFDKQLEQTIINNRIPTSKKLFIEGVVFTQGESHWDSPTGTRYIWREGITPEFLHTKGKYTGFSPTERKNYPVQGFGGEIVQTMLGKVFRYFLENDRFNNDVLLVNTVHDCVLLDGKAGVLEKVAKEVQAILEDVPQTFNDAFKVLNITVPFPCETEVGLDLFNMSGLH